MSEISFDDWFWNGSDPRPPFQLHSDTSLSAAKEIAPSAQNLRERVYDAIAKEPNGLTDSELEVITGLGGSTVRPRRVELARVGRIKKAGVRPTSSGRNAQVWVVNG